MLLLWNLYDLLTRLHPDMKVFIAGDDGNMELKQILVCFKNTTGTLLTYDLEDDENPFLFDVESSTAGGILEVIKKIREENRDMKNLNHITMARDDGDDYAGIIKAKVDNDGIFLIAGEDNWVDISPDLKMSSHNLDFPFREDGLDYDDEEWYYMDDEDFEDDGSLEGIGGFEEIKRHSEENNL